MPIEIISFEDNILHIREYNHINLTDAQKFEQVIVEHTNICPHPIVVLIDAREVAFITPDANRHFVRVSSIAGVKLNVVVTQGLIVTQSARLLELRNRERNTVVYEDWDAALARAQEVAAQARSTS